MAPLRRAAIAVALSLAVVPSAAASTAPIVRLAGTGTPGIYAGNALPALQTSFSYAEALSFIGYGQLAFTDPVDNRVLWVGNSVNPVAGNGQSGHLVLGSDRFDAVLSRPEAISQCCDLPETTNYVSFKDSTSGPNIGSFFTEGDGYANGFDSAFDANTPKDFAYDSASKQTFAAMWGSAPDNNTGTVQIVDGAVVAGGGSRNVLDPIDPTDPLGSNLYNPTSVSLSPDTSGTFIVSTFQPDTPINGYVMKVTNAGDTSNDTIQIVVDQDLMDDEGVLGDGGLAKDADIHLPSSVAYLKDGGFLIYDAGNARIRRVTAGDVDHATISTIAGNGTPGIADPGTPANIAPLASAGATVDGLALRPADIEVSTDGLVMTQGPYGVVQMIPSTAITEMPPALTTSRTASFTLASWDDNATYQCKLDTGSFGTCASLEGLGDGDHTFQAQATTNGGHDLDPSPAAYTWKVDGTPPAPFALGSPAAGATVDPNPTFAWDATSDATTAVARYELWFDGVKTGDVTCCSVHLTNLHDGPHTFQIRAVDTAGNVRPSEERSFNVSAAPTASFTIAPLRALVGRNVTLDASKSSDSNGSIVNYAWDLDGDGSYETDGGASPLMVTSYPKPQTVNVGLRVTDNDGVTGAASGQVVISLQPPPAKQLGVSINDGAQYTNDPDVTVFAVWPGFASDALVSNDGGFKKAVTFPVAEQIPWTLDSSGPERLPKTIYVRFTAGSQTSETYQDDIILDQTPPKVLSASLSSGGSAATAAAAKKVTLKLKAKDNVSGVGGVQATKNKRKPGKVLKYKAKLKVASAPTLYVRVRDRAGNFSSWRKAKR
jgi:hypothetical protein